MTLTIQWLTGSFDTNTMVEVVTGFAVLRLYFSDDVITSSDWLTLTPRKQGEPTALQQRMRQYLERPDSVELTVKLCSQGTPFDRRIWSELIGIPLGQTLTYGQLAARVGSGARAVANACRRNPFPGLIPCHRVVSAGGIGGFMGRRNGPEVELKYKILHFEALSTGSHELPFE